MASLILSHSLGEATQSVTLAWDPNSEPKISGYVLRYGTTRGKPSEKINVGKTTTATVSNLADGTTYFFTVTARNTRLESQPSNEVSYTTVPLGAQRLTVNNGSRSGFYAPGTMVTVSANAPPPGQHFDIWTDDIQILANPFIPTTTATIPSSIAVTVTATYATTPTQVTALSFSEGSSTAAADSSGPGHSGTLINGPTWTAGKFDNGVSLDGTNDYVSVANPSTINFGTSNFTIAVWIKRKATGVEHTIFNKTATGSWVRRGKEFFINGSNNRLGFGSFGVGEVFSTGTITNDGLWHHVAVTFVDSSNTIIFYIDGVASGGGTLNLPADVGSHVVKLGGSATTPGGFRGQVDEFRIFSRALSASEVQTIMNNAIR